MLSWNFTTFPYIGGSVRAIWCPWGGGGYGNLDKGREGVKNPGNFADVICTWPLSVNECEQMCFPTFLLCLCLDQNISLPLSATLLDEYCLLNRTAESPLGSECPLLSLLLWWALEFEFPAFLLFLPKSEVLLSLLRISALVSFCSRDSSSNSISRVPFSDASSSASSYANLQETVVLSWNLIYKMQVGDR